MDFAETGEQALLRVLGPDTPVGVVLVLSSRPDAPALEHAVAKRIPHVVLQDPAASA